MESQNTPNFCPNCGTKTLPNAKFCVECGNSLIISYNNPSEVKQETNTNSINQSASQNVDNKEVNEQISLSNNNDNNSITNSSENESITYKANFIHSQSDSDEVLCPSCFNPMQENIKSSLFSTETHYYCLNCEMDFREHKEHYILEKAPENTKLSNRLLQKQYPMELWEFIFNDNYTPDELGIFKNLQGISATTFNCPVCNDELMYCKGKGFGSSKYLVCSSCMLILEEHKHEKYTLYNTPIIFSPLWKYEKNLLTLEEMRSEINTDKRFPKKENISKEIRIKQREEDMQLFYGRLDEGKPLLPTPQIPIVLKNNEKAVYALSNVFFSEPRSVRTTTGGYGGASVKMSSGITLHGGSVDSVSESHDEIKIVDNGQLVITNKRIIFIGSKRTINIDLNKIISVIESDSALAIMRSNKQKTEYFGNIEKTEKVYVDGREYLLVINASILKRLIMGLIG